MSVKVWDGKQIVYVTGETRRTPELEQKVQFDRLDREHGGQYFRDMLDYGDEESLDVFLINEIKQTQRNLTRLMLEFSSARRKELMRETQGATNG